MTERDPGQVDPGQVEPGQVEPGQVEPGEHGSGQESGRPAADPLVAETAERLSTLEGRPATEHAEVYDELHRRLAGALDEPREGELGL